MVAFGWKVCEFCCGGGVVLRRAQHTIPYACYEMPRSELMNLVNFVESKNLTVSNVSNIGVDQRVGAGDEGDDGGSTDEDFEGGNMSDDGEPTDASSSESGSGSGSGSEARCGPVPVVFAGRSENGFCFWRKIFRSAFGAEDPVCFWRG